MLGEKQGCFHKRLRIYAEKRNGKLIPGIVRCFDCGDEVRKTIKFVTPEQAASIPPGSQVVIGRPIVGGGLPFSKS